MKGEKKEGGGIDCTHTCGWQLYKLWEGREEGGIDPAPIFMGYPLVTCLEWGHPPFQERKEKRRKYPPLRQYYINQKDHSRWGLDIYVYINRMDMVVVAISLFFSLSPSFFLTRTKGVVGHWGVARMLFILTPSNWSLPTRYELLLPSWCEYPVCFFLYIQFLMLGKRKVIVQSPPWRPPWTLSGLDPLLPTLTQIYRANPPCRCGSLFTSLGDRVNFFLSLIALFTGNMCRRRLRRSQLTLTWVKRNACEKQDRMTTMTTTRWSGTSDVFYSPRGENVVTPPQK